jgi:hypothetical protein
MAAGSIIGAKAFINNENNEWIMFYFDTNFYYFYLYFRIIRRGGETRHDINITGF